MTGPQDGNQQRAAEVAPVLYEAMTRGLRLWGDLDEPGRAVWTAHATALLPLVDAAEARGRAEVAAKVKELHRPWYEVGGEPQEHTVTVPCYKDDCVCEGEGHDSLACAECQWTDGDLYGYAVWPCPTIRALAALLAASSSVEQAGDAR